MDVFISWSGTQSKIIAEALGPWLQSVLQFVKPFISVDIEKGIRYEAEISQKLQDCNFGVICVTPESVKCPWVLFEAGALSKLQAEARVYTYVLGMKKGEVPQPLGQFQGTEATHDDTQKLVEAINRRAEAPVSEQVLVRTFEKWWPDLERTIQTASLISEPHSDVKSALSVDEMCAEILDHVRGIRSHLSGRIAAKRGEFTNAIDPLGIDAYKVMVRQLKDAIKRNGLAEAIAVVGEPTLTISPPKPTE